MRTIFSVKKNRLKLFSVPLPAGTIHVLRFVDALQLSLSRVFHRVPLQREKDPIFRGPGPLVIGATGGSGTRILAKAVRDAGCYIGDTVNKALDCMAFTGVWGRAFDPEVFKLMSFFMKRSEDSFKPWISRYAVREKSPLSSEERSAMVSDVLRRLAWLLRNRPSPQTPWGWKIPGCIHYLELLNEIFPSMRFIHVVRDGRDMAFSENQNQLLSHGDVLLPRETDDLPMPVRSAILWNKMNLAAAHYGESVMKDRYIAVRFEDLCTDPGREMARVWEFMGFPPAISAQEASRSVSYPGVLGRWREHPDKRLLRDIMDRAEPGLRKFGYLSGEAQ